MKVVYVTISQREGTRMIEAEHNGERLGIPVAMRSPQQQALDVQDVYNYYLQSRKGEPCITQITFQDSKGQMWTGTCATEHGISKIFRQVEEQVIDELSYKEW